jgi:hypothetical protein
LVWLWDAWNDLDLAAYYRCTHVPLLIDVKRMKEGSEKSEDSKEDKRLEGAAHSCLIRQFPFVSFLVSHQQL